jgi:hypothetical protein
MCKVNGVNHPASGHTDMLTAPLVAKTMPGKCIKTSVIKFRGLSITKRLGLKTGWRKDCIVILVNNAESFDLAQHTIQNKDDKTMAKQFSKGDQVKWKWGDGFGYGEVVEQFTKKVIRSLSGTEVTRNASEDEPAYLISKTMAMRFSSRKQS